MDIILFHIIRYEIIGKILGHFDFGCHLDDLEGVMVVLRNGLPEDTPCFAIFHGHFQHTLGLKNRPMKDNKSLLWLDASWNFGCHHFFPG